MCDSKVLCVSNQVNNRRFLTQTLTRLGVESDSESVDDSFHINAYQNYMIWPLLLIVIFNCFYNICTKSVSEGMNATEQDKQDILRSSESV